MEFDQIPHQMRLTGEQVAKYTALYEFLDGEKKVVLAKLASGFDGSEATRERQALASTEYCIHLEGIKEARHDMLKAKTHYESLQALFELHRTKSADRRSEMKMI